MNLEKITHEITTVLSDQEMWIDLVVILLKVVLITIAAVVLVKVLRVVIRKTFSVRIKGPLLYNERRQQTLSKLLSNVVAYVVYFIAAVSILSTFTIDITGLIAGAGVLGLAVGFGAQNLVRDVITGFFIIFEDQFSVGD